MTESQSRYSIVERLTKKKLEIMTDKEKMNTDKIKLEKELALSESNKDKEVKSIENVYENNKKISKRDYEYEIRDNELNKIKKIEEIEESINARKDRLYIFNTTSDSKIKLYDDKIKAIEKSLDHIKVIGEQGSKE